MTIQLSSNCTTLKVYRNRATGLANVDLYRYFYREKIKSKLIIYGPVAKRNISHEHTRNMSDESQFSAMIAKPNKKFSCPNGSSWLRYIRNCAATVTSRARSNARTHLSMMKTASRVHMQRATLSPMFPSAVVITFGVSPPRKRRNA